MRQGSRGHVVNADTTLQEKVGKLPREGTRLRAAYDLFMANPGKVVPFAMVHGTAHNEIIQLRDYYGLDIRKTEMPKTRILVGMYDTRGEYIDFSGEVSGG